ncbi:hypothetical protein T439DRAFT_359354 [Meredithblackwellia eburnea MCA 4105]
MSPTPKPTRQKPFIGRRPGDLETSLESVAHDPRRREQVERNLLTFDSFAVNQPGFAGEKVGRKFNVTEIRWVDQQGKEVGPEVKRAGVRFTIEVLADEAFCNMFGILHGGCVSYIFDQITSAALITATGSPHVSINLSVSFLGTASVGTKLRVIGSTSSIGRNISHLSGETGIS